MSKEYVDQEIEKIIKDKGLKYPLNLAMAATWVAGNHKGTNLKILELKKVCSLTDFFVIASASNLIQAQAIAEEIYFQAKKYDYTCKSREGLQNSDWILLDFGDIIVHIFLEASRDFYDLDRLWGAAASLPIPQHYYSSGETPSIDPLKGDDAKKYF
ncbi:MAG: ribosome silencing factor [Bdellovibrionales bacterium RIFOXYD12_FULL_39_22]|nr:MAG: ribosome silencing factor [Bdellovibrionales bacterium RIFOXYB1_FULL_39_21]OFZ41742.1 MAG: ribosome silencing factor [Bdellovibrionales bacterium RIFOXYC12_FULL_39_17]OFZ46142.1 MAG: ribosome silencing factor [Bdellovibrionales bacterium RIFOXYC1_FULL_39_130]OFZ71670.1 MAG: ribosome silencing factor [Bdellovibrionales bacterium RIFOXYC2_FULL_39_8]OFZ74968.1 MAG: ribosome silencing factor [Bdellovibrionales bacterium RIFOXYD1_FULL_39_84]OFZ92821.1 MAG: ribosome silencing factor [Bdellov